MKRKSQRQPVAKKLNRKNVEDTILIYLKGGIATADVEFGEVDVKFRDRGLFHRSQKSFRVFILGGINYTQASSDEKKMTITYLFH